MAYRGTIGEGPAYDLQLGCERQAAEAWPSPARAYVLWRGRVVVDGCGRPVQVFDPAVREGAPLGADMAPVGDEWVLDLSVLDEGEALELVAGAAMRQPSDLGAPRSLTETLRVAVALFRWSARHRFCGVCATPTRKQADGISRVCCECGAAWSPTDDRDPAFQHLLPRPRT